MHEMLFIQLIQWYEANQRSLPWRIPYPYPADSLLRGSLHHFYSTYISEIMLQQTQVTTVIPYYHRFKATYPNFEALANSSTETLFELWQGLGYYQRARNLLSGSRAIHELLSQVPSQQPLSLHFPYSVLINIQGIGSYTASAISSIVFNERRFALDGNLKRVLSRLYGLDDLSLMLPLLQSLEQSLALDFGIINQALMDLANSCCRPQPKCQECPLASHCVAFQEDRVEQYLKNKKATIKRHHLKFIWLRYNGEWWLFKNDPFNKAYVGSVNRIWQNLHLPLVIWDFHQFNSLPIQALQPIHEFEYHLTHKHFTIQQFVYHPSANEWEWVLSNYQSHLVAFEPKLALPTVVKRAMQFLVIN